jgi:hypothetical protein
MVQKGDVMVMTIIKFRVLMGFDDEPSDCIP